MWPGCASILGWLLLLQAAPHVAGEWPGCVPKGGAGQKG